MKAYVMPCGWAPPPPFTHTRPTPNTHTQFICYNKRTSVHFVSLITYPLCLFTTYLCLIKSHNGLFLLFVLTTNVVLESISSHYDADA